MSYNRTRKRFEYEPKFVPPLLAKSHIISSAYRSLVKILLEKASSIKSQRYEAIARSAHKIELWVDWKPGAKKENTDTQENASTISSHTSIHCHHWAFGGGSRKHIKRKERLEYNSPPTPHPTSVTALSVFNPINSSAHQASSPLATERGGVSIKAVSIQSSKRPTIPSCLPTRKIYVLPGPKNVVSTR